MKALGCWVVAAIACGCSSPPAGNGDFSAICSGGSSCTLTRYGVEAIFGSNATAPISVAIGSGAAPPLAIAEGTEIAIEGSDGTWTTEQVTGSDLPELDFDGAVFPPAVSLALGADGTRWLAMFSDGDLWVAHGAGARWTIDHFPPAQAAFPADAPVPGGLVITSTGEVVVGYVAYDGVYLETWAGSGWTLSEPISGGLPDTYEYSAVALALDPATDGTQVALAWQTANWTGDDIEGSLYYQSMAGGSAELVDPTRGAGSWPVSLAFDSMGHANVAYLGGTADHAARGDDGTWTLDSIPGGGVSALAAGPDGELAAMFGATGAGIGVAQRGSADGSWSSQVLNQCTFGGLAFSGDQLEIADCAGLLTPTGDYPDDYMELCERDAQVLCEAAAACPPDSSDVGCITGSNGESCYWSLGNCEYYQQVALCGDSTRDPSKVIACAAALETGIACRSDSTFVELPDACK